MNPNDVTGLFMALAMLGAVGAIILATAHQVTRSDALKRTLEAVGRARGGGDVTAGFMGGSPSLRFRAGDATWTIEYTQTGGKNPVFYTDVYVEFPGGSPSVNARPEGVMATLGKLLGSQDAQLGDPAFDARWVVQGDPEAVGDMFEEPVRAALETLRRSRGRDHVALTVEGRDDRTKVHLRALEWTSDEPKLHQHLDLCAAVVDALRAARNGPWERVARSHGLELGDVNGLPRLVGHLAGAPVDLRVERTRSGWVTTVRAGLRGPEGLFVAHRDHLPDVVRPRPVGNPVLDMTVGVAGDDPEALRALFADDERAAAVLGVVHAHPGSIVTHEGALLRSHGWALSELPGLVDRMEALLRAWPAASPDAPGASAGRTARPRPVPEGHSGR